MSSAVYHATNTAFKALIGNCRFMQKKFYEIETYFDIHSLAQNCGVHVYGGRRQGKTWAAINLMYDDRWFPNGLFIGPNNNFSANVWTNCAKNLFPEKACEDRNRFLSIDSRALHGFNDALCEGVFIDSCLFGFDATKRSEHVFECFADVANARLKQGRSFCFVFFQ